MEEILSPEAENGCGRYCEGNCEGDCGVCEDGSECTQYKSITYNIKLKKKQKEDLVPEQDDIDERIENEFENEARLEATSAAIYRLGKTMGEVINGGFKPSRERSLVITKLQEMLMWSDVAAQAERLAGVSVDTDPKEG